MKIWTFVSFQAVRNVLRECYGDKNAVDDELVDYILKPGLEVKSATSFWIPWMQISILLLVQSIHILKPGFFKAKNCQIKLMFPEEE